MSVTTNDAGPGQRIALVTGANRGLGFETARQLARQGCSVLMASRDLRDGRDAAQQLQHEKLAVRAVELDVTNPASLAALASQLREQAISLDVLVCNAGISLSGFNLDVVRRTLAVNFFGALHVTDGLLPLLRDGANVVEVSSGMGELSAFSAGLRARFLDAQLTRAQLIALVEEFVAAVERGDHQQRGWPSSAYRVSKAALNALVRIVAPELAPRRIRINAVCPGWVRTDMGGPSAARSVEHGAASITWAAMLSNGGPSGGFFRDERSIAW